MGNIIHSLHHALHNRFRSSTHLLANVTEFLCLVANATGFLCLVLSSLMTFTFFWNFQDQQQGAVADEPEPFMGSGRFGKPMVLVWNDKGIFVLSLYFFFNPSLVPCRTNRNYEVQTIGVFGFRNELIHHQLTTQLVFVEEWNGLIHQYLTRHIMQIISIRWNHPTKKIRINSWWTAPSRMNSSINQTPLSSHSTPYVI